MNPTHTAAVLRRAAIGSALAGLLLAGISPTAPSASAQSGRQIPEKARKSQPAPTAPPPGSTTAPPPDQPAAEQRPSGQIAPPAPPPVSRGDVKPDITLSADVVDVETVVVEKKTGVILRGLKRESFEVYEDGVKQEITNFAPTEGPITLVFIIEFSKRIDNNYIRKSEVLNPAALFVTQFVKPADNIAIIAFDTRPFVVTDFTNDDRKLAAGMQFLFRNYPAFSESNLYDTLHFVLQGGKLDGEDYTGLKAVQSRSAIVLVSLGIDTFSKINYDDIKKEISRAGVPIYTVGVGNLYYKLAEPRLRPEDNLTWLQAFNTMRSFSTMTGGKYFPVTFATELPSTMQSISNLLRSQYSIGYEPTNTRHEGKTRKIEVKVDVDGDGKFGDKGYEVQNRSSYIEPLDPRPAK